MMAKRPNPSESLSVPIGQSSLTTDTAPILAARNPRRTRSPRALLPADNLSSHNSRLPVAMTHLHHRIDWPRQARPSIATFDGTTR